MFVLPQTSDLNAENHFWYIFICHYIKPTALKEHIWPWYVDVLRVRTLMKKLHREFGIDNVQIVLTTIDNGSNFIKAYKEFVVTGKNLIIV